MKRFVFVVLAFCLLLSTIMSQCFAEVHYQEIDLGLLPGFTSAAALGINNRGEVVGITRPVSGSNHAFYWSDSTGMIDLGQGWAYGINNKGQIAGSYGNNACIWDSPTSRRLLQAGACRSINDLGEATGVVLTNGNHAAYWNVNGALTDLAGQVGGGSEGYSINNSGLIAGSGGGYAFTWNSITKQTRNLMPLPGGGYCRVRDVNDLGQVAGTSEMNGTTQYVTVWNPDGSTRIFGQHTYAGLRINNLGQVIGEKTIWNPDGTVVNLSTDFSAQDINDNGWVVGETLRGSGRAILLKPVPEPSSLAVLIVGLSGMAGLLKRKSS